MIKMPSKARTVVGRGGGEPACYVTPDLSYDYYRREREKMGEEKKREEKEKKSGVGGGGVYSIGEMYSISGMAVVVRP